MKKMFKAISGKKIKKVIINKANNALNVIHPYRTSHRTWVYDDEDLKVYKEAFVMGSSEVIDHLVGEETNFFDAIISANPLPNPTAILVKIQKEMDHFGAIEGWYQLQGTDMEHWLCGKVLDYFTGYPDTIYVKIENPRP